MQIAPARNSKKATPHQSEQFRIEEAVQRCLDESGYAQLWTVACRCRVGTAVLTGQVPSFYMKQVAQTIVSKIDGVEQVDNLLEVVTQTTGKEAVWS